MTFSVYKCTFPPQLGKKKKKKEKEWNKRGKMVREKPNLFYFYKFLSKTNIFQKKIYS